MNADYLKFQDSHASMRKFKDQSIEPDLLQEILKTGTRAATSSNMQYYAIILSQDKAQKEKLYTAHNSQAMILQAPLLLTFCADLHRMQSWFDARQAKTSFANELSLVRGIIDASIVAQNVTLAAEAMGLGVCYMGSTLTGIKDIVDILKLPQLVVPVTTLCMGYPDEEKKRIERLPMQAVLHEEVYQPFTAEKINAVYSTREKEYWHRFLNNPQRKQFLERDDVNNLAQAYQAMKFDQQDLERKSKNLWACYQEQCLKTI